MQIVGKTDRHRHRRGLPARPGDVYRDHGVRLRDPPHPDAGGGLPQRRPASITIADRRGEEAISDDHVLCRRHPGVCHLHQPEQDPHPRRGHLHGRLQRGRHGGGRPPIQRQLQRDHCLLCQQRPHPRRAACTRTGFKRALTNALNAYGQEDEDPQGGREGHRRGLPGRAHLRHLRQAHRGPV